MQKAAVYYLLCIVKPSLNIWIVTLGSTSFILGCNLFTWLFISRTLEPCSMRNAIPWDEHTLSNDDWNMNGMCYRSGILPLCIQLFHHPITNNTAYVLSTPVPVPYHT